jgi:hypothetical protein
MVQVIQLAQLRKLIDLILTSIFIAAAVIAIGTPIAAIIIFRNQRKVLNKPAEPQQITLTQSTSARR